MVPKRSRRVFLKHMSGLAIASGLAARLSSSALANSGDAALDDLAKTLAENSLGQIVRPGSPDYSKIKYYNARFDCVRTKAYLRPASAEGVLKIVEWAKLNRRTLAIRGGGHSFEGKSSHPDLVIDMSRLTKLSFENSGILEVEAGVLLGDIYKTIAPAGHVLPAGTCPTVGVVGHTLGGGIGDFLPIFGYAAQSLTAATLVTLGGTILKVNDQAIEVAGGAPLPSGDIKPQDLLKVLRGGGQGSLGIVTSMTFRTQDVSRTTLVNFQLEGADDLTPEKAVAIIQGWQGWREGLPRPMHAMVSSKLNLGRSGNGCGIDIQGLIAVPPD